MTGSRFPELTGSRSQWLRTGTLGAAGKFETGARHDETLDRHPLP